MVGKALLHVRQAVGLPQLSSRAIQVRRNYYYDFAIIVEKGGPLERLAHSHETPELYVPAKIILGRSHGLFANAYKRLSCNRRCYA